MPPWATTARRGFHESARSGYSQIGTAYYKDVIAARKVEREREDAMFSARTRSTAHSTARSRPRTGMSRLVGV